MEMVLNKIEEVLVESGRYSSRKELIEDALRALIREKPELRVDVAAELYKKERYLLPGPLKLVD